MIITTEGTFMPAVLGKRTGKAPAKSNPKLLQLSQFMKRAEVPPPSRTTFWEKRKPFPLRSFGNNDWGDCTRASQALLQMRTERIEQRRDIKITDEEVIRVYLDMIKRLYGAQEGEDTGAYELDALSEWRNPDLTFRDTKGRPLTIDAFTAINFRDINEVKRAIALSGAHGIKVCFNLPAAWSSDETYTWTIPENQPLTGEWMPGTWGGHSMCATRYDANFIYVPHSWNVPDGRISWAAFAAYCDEAYLIIDSINAWKKRLALTKDIDFKKLVGAVNDVSSTKIAA